MASGRTKVKHRMALKHGFAVNKEQVLPREIARETKDAARKYQETAAHVDDTTEQLLVTEDELSQQALLIERIADKLGITADLRRLHTSNARRAKRIRASLKGAAPAGVKTSRVPSRRRGS